MKKVIGIEGMHCEGCVGRATRALEALDGVSAKVDLKHNNAVIDLKNDIDDEVLRQALDDANLKLTSVEVKKGLFGK